MSDEQPPAGLDDPIESEPSLDTPASDGDVPTPAIEDRVAAEEAARTDAGEGLSSGPGDGSALEAADRTDMRGRPRTDLAAFGSPRQQPEHVSEPTPPVASTSTAAPEALPTSWPDPIPVSAPTLPPGRFDGARLTPPLVVLGGLVTLSFLMFVTIEPTPRWLLLFTAVIAVLGTDGALRQAWPRLFGRTSDPADTTPYLFLPALAAIAWPMLIEHNVRGYLVLPAALIAGGAYVAVLIAQISSVRISAPAYPLARIVSTAAVYFSAFALFSLSYVLDVRLVAAVAAVGVMAAMLGVELYREGQVDPLETLVFAGVTGVILGEARWAMYYIPIGGYLGGLALLLGFFLATGLLHSHLTRHLSNVVALEYAGIAAAGLLLVTIAGQAGLG